jgi:ATP-dependent Zn protease
MTYGEFFAASLAITSLCCLFFFNARFSKNFASLLWRSKWLVILPIAFFFAAEGIMGAAVVKSAVPNILVFAMTILQALLFGVFQIFIMFWAMGRVESEIFLPGDPGSSLEWESWIGAPAVREEAQRMVASIANWEQYEKNGSKPANGALFLGPPGTGKSLMARVIAAKAGMPVMIVASSSLNGPFMGMGRMLVQSLARKVNKLSARYGGMVVFLDEIDAVGMARGGLIGGGGGGGMMGMGGGGGSNGTLQTLLTVMSGAASGETWFLRMRKRWGLASKHAKQVKRILWIAATNVDVKQLDPALVRSGRFGSIKLFFNYPTAEARDQLFKLYLARKTVDDSVKANWKHLAKLSSRMSGADIEEICEAAGRTAVYRFQADAQKDSTLPGVMEASRSPAVSYQLLWEQIRIKKFGHPKPLDMHPDEKHPVAVHEGGHGVAVVDFPPEGMLCAGATLRPTEDFVAAVLSERDENRMMSNEEDLYRQILIAVNSRAAEEEILGKRYSGTSSDFQKAMAIAIHMSGVVGMGEKITSMLATDGKPSAKMIEEAEFIVNATFEFAKTYTRERRAAIEGLANLLETKTDLTGPDVIECVQSYGKPKLNSIMEEIQKIVVRMKAEAKKARIEDMAAVDAMSRVKAPARAVKPVRVAKTPVAAGFSAGKSAAGAKATPGGKEKAGSIKKGSVSTRSRR